MLAPIDLNTPRPRPPPAPRLSLTEESSSRGGCNPDPPPLWEKQNRYDSGCGRGTTSSGPPAAKKSRLDIGGKLLGPLVSLLPRKIVANDYDSSDKAPLLC